MEDIMLKFAVILQENPDKAYDFIANNSHNFSKGELADIIKELLYSIYYEAEYGLLTKKDHDKILASAGEEIVTQYAEY